MTKIRQRKSKKELDNPEEVFKSTPKLKIQDLLQFEPLTNNQNKFFELYDDKNKFIFLSGYAGTGKSFISLYKAVEDVLDRRSQAKRVLVVRSTVQGRDIGHLPGDVEEKINIFSQPYQAICKELFARGDAWNLLKENKVIDFCSTSFLRGNTYSSTIIICDEIQNYGWGELNTIVTRVGEGSKIIFCGDYRQNDLTLNKNDVSGLSKFVSIASTMPSFNQIEFGINDICRSGLCKEWLIAEANYDKENTKIFM